MGYPASAPKVSWIFVEEFDTWRWYGRHLIQTGSGITSVYPLPSCHLKWPPTTDQKLSIANPFINFPAGPGPVAGASEAVPSVMWIVWTTLALVIGVDLMEDLFIWRQTHTLVCQPELSAFMKKHIGVRSPFRRSENRLGSHIEKFDKRITSITLRNGWIIIIGDRYFSTDYRVNKRKVLTRSIILGDVITMEMVRYHFGQARFTLYRYHIIQGRTPCAGSGEHSLIRSGCSRWNR